MTAMEKMDHFDTIERRLSGTFRDSLGPEINAALAREDVQEIFISSDGELRIIDGTGKNIGSETFSENRRNVIIRLCSHEHNIPITWKLAVDLPGTGDRFHALLPPVVPAACITIRRHFGTVIPLASWIEQGRITDARAALARQTVRGCRGIAISGATGSGKTTLLNSLAGELEPTERVITIEERSRELRLPGIGDKEQLLATEDGPNIHQLCKETLRMRPDRVIVGEALDGGTLLEAMKIAKTGHKGMLMTVHADSARETLMRLESLIMEVSKNPLPDRIAGTIGLIIYMENATVIDVLGVNGWDGKNYLLSDY